VPLYGTMRATNLLGAGVASSPTMPTGTTAVQTIEVVTGRFDSLVHRGLNTLLEEDCAMRLIATGLDAPALESIVANSRPNVAIVDRSVALPALKRLRALGPRTGILVLEDRPSRTSIAAALAVGVTCIAREAADADLLDAVRLVALGTPVFTSHDGRRVEPRRPLSRTSELTRRQHEVLRHLSHAKSDGEIALALQISIRTVEKARSKHSAKAECRRPARADWGIASPRRAAAAPGKPLKHFAVSNAQP
jgi:two-component system, NarL family, response regulator LiaR